MKKILSIIMCIGMILASCAVCFAEDDILTAPAPASDDILIAPAPEEDIVADPVQWAAAKGPEGETYMSDTENGKVVKFTTGRMTTIVSGLDTPTSVALFDKTLYVCETGKNRILKIDLRTKQQTVVGGMAVTDEYGEYVGAYVDGPAAKSEFDHPIGVAVDENGVVFVADTGNMAIRRIRDGMVSTVFANRNGFEMPVVPQYIRVNNGKLDIYDGYLDEVATLEPAGAPFTDIPAGAACEAAAYTLRERGVLVGTTDTTFSPDKLLTRAQFAAMVTRLAQIDDGNLVINGDRVLKDVKAGAWYESYAKWSLDNEIVYGYNNGLFAPDKTITAWELGKMLSRFASYLGSEWTLEASAAGAAYTEDSASPITRAEAAAITAAFLDEVGM